MKQRIEILQVDIGTLMQRHLSKGDFEIVTSLSPLLSRVQDLQRRSAEIDQELSELESAIKALKARPTLQKGAETAPPFTKDLDDHHGSERSRLQTLKITIDWKANKRSKGSEEISENTAAATMEHFISRVIEELGNDALQKMEKMRINRGPLISKNPAKDFVNQIQGKLYGHRKIRGTDYYILTHSQTSQKVEDLSRVCRVVGFTQGSVQIIQINRHSWLDGLN